jgi:hypothetical protein
MGDQKRKDDERYVALMDKYKRMRLKDGKKALVYLDAAMALKERGNVSEDAITGGAYL